ncbi:uncharacterized protein [Macrobrachium rosenbergii]|uniref:uncharacterized protein n=1 Tax=Macrobrachium rosenbergii TaxID=79674 RepID=UPI0034D5430B
MMKTRPLRVMEKSSRLVRANRKLACPIRTEDWAYKRTLARDCWSGILRLSPEVRQNAEVNWISLISDRLLSTCIISSDWMVRLTRQEVKIPPSIFPPLLQEKSRFDPDKRRRGQVDVTPLVDFDPERRGVA